MRRIRQEARAKTGDLDFSDLPDLDEIPTEIADLTHLIGFYCEWTGITDISNLAPLSALQRVSILACDVRDLSPLASLVDLQFLNCSISMVEDLSPLVSLTDLQTLDCSETLVSDLTPLRSLAALRKLDFADTVVADLSPLALLTSLQEINCSRTEVSDLSILASLPALEELHCSDTPIGDLSPLVPLSSLKELSCRNTRVSDLSPVAQLSSLQALDCSDTHVSDLSPLLQLRELRSIRCYKAKVARLPSDLSKLINLESLWLQSNRLANLPRSLLTLPRLKSLQLHGNPSLGLSPEVLGPNELKDFFEEETPARTILDAYFSRETGRIRSLNEVKLILVGRGGAGKTCTVDALHDRPFQEGRDSTPGIALCDWTMEGCKGEPVTAHVWDFAGQVITHALHQFFFSSRCVYVVVLTGRENSEREDAEYWLRLIKAFGSDGAEGPPVLVALNKWDVPGCRPKLDRGALQERYPFIRGFVQMDCKSGKGIAKLKTALCKEVSRLKWVRESFAVEWDDVRRDLNKHRKKRAHLTFQEFRELCRHHGVTSGREQESLSVILHNLGIALNYRNDPRLKEATVLLPDWLTKNVYALMRRAERQNGLLKQADVDLVLKKEQDPKMRKYLVHLMERFEIAYAAKASGGSWLVPQALPDTQPAAVAAFREAAEATRLRYSYQALPEGLVARAIVRLHEFIEEAKGKRLQWASGAIFTREGARALLRTEPQDRQVMFTITGPEKARQQLAGLCQAEMREIHGDIRGLDPQEETEVSGQWVSVVTLEEDEQNRRQTGIPTKQGTVMVDPRIPNDAFSTLAARSEEVWKPSVFISYSKHDVTQRTRLERELKVLMNEGLLEKGWHDRMIAPGERWDDRIQEELADADVIIILISSASISTDYITKHEIPVAMERHRAGNVVVVPVILENCRWTETELGDLNALPEKAKALNKWAPRSDGWSSVSNGLAEVLKAVKSKGTTGKKPRRMSGLTTGGRLIQ